MKFSFATNKFTPIEGQPHRFHVLTLEEEADTVEQAFAQVEPKIPEGHKMFCWWSDEKVEE